MGILTARAGSVANRGLQWAKKAAYRWPLLREFTRPRYAFNIEPAQLAWLCDAIGETRAGSAGCVVEVGCARGLTTAFLLRHMSSIRDHRAYICVDTFDGFVQTDVDYEVAARGKTAKSYGGFRYNDADIFRANIVKCGYKNVQVKKADISQFPWDSIPRVDVMLVDVDLYRPTLSALTASFPRWSDNACIMIDDCHEHSPFDGARAAYLEFCAAHGLTPAIIGGKGGVIDR